MSFTYFLKQLWEGVQCEVLLIVLTCWHVAVHMNVCLICHLLDESA